jgi:predicted dithiol-disulfide oxidoreductase (DUF899 family)
VSLPAVVSREEWLAARKDLLAKEKEWTRQRDALSAERRRLPMVRVPKDYVFTGPDGECRLIDLFGRNLQLAMRHFMFEPEWEDGCPSCTAAADEMSRGLFEHLHARDTHIVHVARAPIEKIERYREKKGWKFPFYSSYGSDFNYDFGVTVDHSRGADTYNYRELEAEGEYPGTSFFLRVGEDVFHTYSTFARGGEQFGGSYYWLDMSALGRQEDWEEPKGRADAVREARPDFAS